MTDSRWEVFGGSLMVVTKLVEPVRETLQRCREADAARIADGLQDQFLWNQSAPPRVKWQRKYFER